MNLVCSICGTRYGDDAPDVCDQCSGKLISSRVKYEREMEEQDRVEKLWDSYYQGPIKPAFQIGFMRRK